MLTIFFVRFKLFSSLSLPSLVKFLTVLLASGLMTGSEGLGEEGGAGRVGMRNTILSGEVHCVVEKEKKN